MTRDRRGAERRRDETVDGEPLERDEALAADFAAMREELEDSDRVPGFGAMLEGARARAGGGRTPRWHLWAPVAAAAAAAGLLLLGPPASDAEADFERLVADYSTSAAGGAWRSPTGPLLEIPGVDLGSVPSIGGSLDGSEPAGRQTPQGRDS